MMAGSLKWRLLLAASLAIAIALTLAGAGLQVIFERHVVDRALTELDMHNRQLAAAIEIAADGSLSVARPPADTRFQQPLSGLYWQLANSTGDVVRSRSLWDQILPSPSGDSATSSAVRRDTIGPNGSRVLIQERTILLRANDKTQALVLSVAIDRNEIAAAVSSFQRDLVVSLMLLLLFLLLAVWCQVAVGLRPLATLRERLAAVQSGQAKSLIGTFPSEVTPLVADLNALLEEKERAIEKARSRAGDLAHGLKTPLTLISGIAEALRIDGDAKAESLAVHVEAMTRHIDRELSRARISFGRVKPPIPIARTIDDVIATMQRMPRSDGLQWRNEVPSSTAIAVDPIDLAELLGNLLDNARKWAVCEVRIGVHEVDEANVLSVEDDGPGIPTELMSTALERGGRLDETRPGSGLGLAIVGDLAEAYGWLVSLGASRLGGLCVSITTPRHDGAKPTGRKGTDEEVVQRI